MDREGFRNRLNQYKKAREENPGLKYWEWKSIPKYDEGGEVEPDPLNALEQNTELDKLQQLRQKANSLLGQPNQFLDDWNKARLATGRFDDQLGGGLLEQQKQNRDSAPIFTSAGTYGKYSYLRAAAPIQLKTDTPEETYNRYQEDLKRYVTNTARRINNNEAQQGEYNKLAHTIFYKTRGINPMSTLLHELAHASKAQPQENKIKEILLKNKQYNSVYTDDESEVYSRLMLVREANQIDPNKIWDKQSLKEFKKTATDFNFLNRYNDETILDIFNNVADAGNLQETDNKIFMAAEGGTVPGKPHKHSERPVIDFDPETGKTTYGYNPGAGYLSGTDPIGEAMMWGLGGGAASATLRSLFPTYGATAGWLAFGDHGKENDLVVPINSSKNRTPIETGLVNKEVRQYYADDVLPRDILTSEVDKLRFLNTDKNFEYDLYPSEFFGDGVAGHYDHLADKIRLNGGYTTNKDLLDNVMSHEVNHRYNKEFPLDKEHNRMLNRAYTVEPNLNTPAARAARKPSEKRATNVNIRHKLQTDLRNTLGHKPTKAEMDLFIDSLSDQELLDRLGSASSYGSAYLMSIEDRADIVNQPADRYKKARVTALRKALKRIAMNEDKNDNNQNYA